MTDLPTKYRPDSFDKVRGQDTTTRALKRLTRNREKQAFLFTGPPGTGKTTLARIVAREMGTRELDIKEIDAATHTGIDAWREIRSTLMFSPMGAKGGSRCIIVDEAHRLSKQAWDSLLKDTEEPPKHVIWVFCTTEPTKVPKAIHTRCATFALRPVSRDEIYNLLADVCDEEKFPTSDEVLDVFVRACEGSPRQALSYLEVGHDVRTTDEAAALCESVASAREPIELARGLLNQTLSWSEAVVVCKSLQDTTPAESIRRLMVGYMSKVLLDTKKESAAEPILAVMQSFEKPFPSDAKAAEVLLPIGRLLLG